MTSPIYFNHTRANLTGSVEEPLDTVAISNRLVEIENNTRLLPLNSFELGLRNDKLALIGLEGSFYLTPEAASSIMTVSGEPASFASSLGNLNNPSLEHRLASFEPIYKNIQKTGSVLINGDPRYNTADSVHGATYERVSNSKAFGHFCELAQGPEALLTELSIQGRQMRLGFQSPTMAEFVSNRKGKRTVERLAKKLVGYNSEDRSTSLKAFLSTLLEWCTNGCTSFKEGHSIKARHTENVIRNFTSRLADLSEAYNSFNCQDVADKMQGLNNATMIEGIQALGSKLSASEVRAYKQQAEDNPMLSAWDLLNEVNENSSLINGSYAQQERGEELATRLYSSRALQEA